MALASTPQDDWGAGIHRGRKSPVNAVYDAVNALINDEGLLFRRGGSAYQSTTNTTSNLTWLQAPYLPAVNTHRILTGGTEMYVLSGSTPVLLGAGVPIGRIAGLGDYAVFLNPSGGSFTFLYYAGSLKATSYTTGTVSVTAGDTTLTGSGTSWLANVDAGMIFRSGFFAVVKSVDSDTQITLTRGAPSTLAGATYELDPASGGFAPPGGTPTLPRAYLAVAGQRFLMALGNRVYYSPRNDLFGLDETTYHELPANVTIIGAEGRGDDAWIFTTGGAYAISNLSLDDEDDYGNIQHTVQQITKDVILWDDYGIAGFAGGLVIPCLDDAFVAASDFSLQPITGDATNEKVRRLYRSYVKAGYTPGIATTHRGHYFLPIMNGSTWIDTLVCRVDRGAAWTRWSGHAAGTAFATLPTQKLLGTSAKRVIDASGCFDPTSANATDADATVADCVITTRDYPTGQKAGFVQKLRARYELTDDGSGGTAAPTVAVAYSSDQDAGVFTTLTDRGEEGGAAGWGVSDGSKYQFTWVAKRRERIRFRFTQSGAAASFVFRTLEMLHRPQGRQ